MGNQEKVKVLVCDDSMLVRKKLKGMLEEEMDCLVCEASNGVQAVEVYKREMPQLVFMDIVMPEADGLEALRGIREFNKDAKVVMLSSTGTSSKLIEALKIGATDFIQKPYDQEQIQKALAKVRA